MVHMSRSTATMPKIVNAPRDILDPHYTVEDLAYIDLMQSRINVARAILAARLDKGMTQDEVGRKAGTKQSRVSEIEGLRGNPRFDTLDRLARVLGLMVTLMPWSAALAGERKP